MGIEVLFYTQVATILAFVVTLFVLYRTLVSQKDATIQLLKEKALFLEQKLSHAEKKVPDALAKSLSERIGNLTAEIERLSKDKSIDQNLMKEKESELEKIKEEASELSLQVSNANELMSEFFCAHCNAPMAERAFQSESVEYNGREMDVDHEYVQFECGLTFHDGKETSACKAR